MCIRDRDDACHKIGKGNSTNLVQNIDDVRGDADTVDVLDIGNLDYGDINTGKISSIAGKAAVEWVLKAGELARDGQVRAIITAPINKEAASLAGYRDIGHMEIFQNQTGAKEVATMLMADQLRVVHLTTHRALRVACDLSLIHI